MNLRKWWIAAAVSGAGSMAFLGGAAPANAEPAQEEVQIRLGDSGFCLDGKGPDERKDGTTVELHDCFSKDSEYYGNQKWTYLEKTKQFRLPGTEPDVYFCLDHGTKENTEVEGEYTAAAWLMKCLPEGNAALPHQQWTWNKDTGNLVLGEDSKMCLDSGNERKNGAGTRIWRCLDPVDKNQKWDVTPAM